MLEVFNILPIVVSDLRTAIVCGKGIGGIKFILKSKLAQNRRELYKLQRQIMLCVEELDGHYSIGDFYVPASVCSNLFNFMNLENNHTKKGVDFISSLFFHTWTGRLKCLNQHCSEYNNEIFNVSNSRGPRFVYGLGPEYPSSTILDAKYQQYCRTCGGWAKLPDTNGTKTLTSYPKILVCQVNVQMCDGSNLTPPLVVKTANVKYHLIAAIASERHHFYSFVKYDNKWFKINSTPFTSICLRLNVIPDLPKKRGYGFELLFYVRQ